MNKKVIFFGSISVLIIGIIVTIILIIVNLTPVKISTSTMIGTSSDSTPEISITSTKSGTIYYEGSCDSLTTEISQGENKIIFEELIDGTYNDCKIIAGSGEEQSITLEEFIIDTTSPTTSASTDYSNGNWATTCTIIFVCSDELSGCSGETHYIINDGSEEVGDYVTFTSEGIYSLEYWNIDEAGNEEETNTEFNNIKIYTSIPSPEITTDSDHYNDTFDLEYEASDSTHHCYYKVNDGSAEGYELCDGVFEDITFDEDEEYEIIIYENSSVGKIGVTSSITIYWDTTEPEVSISNLDAGETYTQSGNSTLEIILDYDDDVDVCQYSLDEDDWDDFEDCDDTNVELGDLLDTDSSAQKIYVRGIDEAGNVGDAESISIYYTS